MTFKLGHYLPVLFFVLSLMRKYNFFWQAKELPLMQKKWKASHARICANIPLLVFFLLSFMRKYNFFSQVKELLLMQKEWKASKSKNLS